jgi:hypothetical protein
LVRRLAALITAAFGLVVLLPASASAATAVTGLFGLTAGSCASGKPTGSYFRMVQPSGSVDSGPFVANGDSTCGDQTYTLLSPGADGGFVTDAYQPAPNPVFDASGNSQAARIAQPATFFGVKFGLSTDPTDLQTNKAVPPLSLHADGNALSGDWRAWSASWNKQYFNQGAPKPDGSKPGLTRDVHGTLDAATGHFVLEWASTVVGGPFNKFTGSWHLEGTYRSSAAAPAASSAGPGAATAVAGRTQNATATTLASGAAASSVSDTGAAAASTGAQPGGGGAQQTIGAVDAKGWRPPAWLIIVTALTGVLATSTLLLWPSTDADRDADADGPSPDAEGSAPVARPKRRRGPQAAALAIGLGLALAPVAFQMFTRAPKGGDMIESFKPYMTTSKIDSFRGFLDDIGAANQESAKALSARRDAASYGGVAALNREWPGIDADMGSMLTTMRRDIPKYKGVAALPPFVLFPWFFVLPGVMIAGFALTRGQVRVVALTALGIGLIAAPAVFGMFTRAPGGAEMINDFKPLMQQAKVGRVQSYFLTIGLAEGDLRNKLVPAEAAAGRPMPASSALSAEWAKQSGDMAPMIAAMADNLENFNAVVALPPFWLFPWFFVAPGILVLGIALALSRSPNSEALTVQNIIGFPNPVNEVSARLVATGVVLMSAAAVVFDVKWILPVLFYGFVARVLTGPKLSPLGQLVTKQITPRLPFEEKLVAGPPKRFAQGMGVTFSGVALLLTVTGHWFAAQVVLGLLIFAASLEGFVGVCLGCKIFAVLMRWGVIPDDVCEACNNVGARIKSLETAQ